MPTIRVDADLCVGSGECVSVTPRAFALESDDEVVRVLDSACSVDGGLLAEAAAACPTGAIAISTE